jgi:hypothetical protein
VLPGRQLQHGFQSFVDRAIRVRYENSATSGFLACQEDEAMTSPQKLKLDSIVQRDADVIGAEADQDIVMVSIANGAYYGVSHVAREIWEAVENPKKISDLIGDLTASYIIDRSLCEEQTLSFLEDLLAEGLLQVRDAQAS